MSVENPLKYRKSFFLKPSDQMPPPRMRSVSPLPSKKETNVRSIFTGSFGNEESRMNTEFLRVHSHKPIEPFPVKFCLDKELDAISEVSESEKSILGKETGAGDDIPDSPEFPTPKPATFSKLKKDPKYQKFVEVNRKNRVDQQLSLSFKKLKSQIDQMNEMIRGQDIKSNIILESLKTSNKIPRNNEVVEKFKEKKNKDIEEKPDESSKDKIEDPSEPRNDDTKILKTSRLVPSFPVGILVIFFVTFLIIFVSEGGNLNEMFNFNRFSKSEPPEPKLSIFQETKKGIWEQVCDFLNSAWTFARNQ